MSLSATEHDQPQLSSFSSCGSDDENFGECDAELNISMSSTSSLRMNDSQDAAYSKGIFKILHLNRLNQVTTASGYYFCTSGKRIQLTISIAVCLPLILADLMLLVFFFELPFLGNILLSCLAGIVAADFSAGLVCIHNLFFHLSHSN